jgi:hypothetical protein
LVNVISLSLSQSDPIKRLALYIYVIIFFKKYKNNSFFFVFQESLQDFCNHGHQSLIAGLRDFTGSDRRPNVFELFEEDHRCSIKLSTFIRRLKQELVAIISRIRPVDQQPRPSAIGYRQILQLASICRNAARDCRDYIRIIEWISAEPDDLDYESAVRSLQEIEDILLVPEFESGQNIPSTTLVQYIILF